MTIYTKFHNVKTCIVLPDQDTGIETPSIQTVLDKGGRSVTIGTVSDMAGSSHRHLLITFSAWGCLSITLFINCKGVMGNTHADCY